MTSGVDASIEVAPEAAAATGPIAPAEGTRDAAVHYPCFDGLRAIAAITVLFHHVSFPTARMSNGWWAPYLKNLDIGVGIFFLISGFLLYRPFVWASMHDRPHGNLRAFFLRRGVRIFPAYWAALTGIILFIGLQNPIVGGTRGHAIYYGLVHIYDRTYAYGGISQAWTLAVEITFYLFLPVYAAVIRRASRGRTLNERLAIEVGGLVALVVIALGWRAFCAWGPSGYLRELGGYWLPANLDLFAFGMVLAVYASWAARRGRVPRVFGFAGRHPAVPWAAALLTFAVLAETFRVNDLPLGLVRADLAVSPWYGFFVHYAWVFTAFFLLLPAVFGPQDTGAVRRFLRWEPIAYLGVISYGFYLWHQAWVGKVLSWLDVPLFTAHFTVVLVVAFVWTVATASASWFLLERPVMRWAHRAATARANRVKAESP